MKITPELQEYIEKQWKWDDDLRQELYLKILEAPAGTIINKGWAVTVYNNLLKNALRDTYKQTQLRVDNAATIRSEMGLSQHIENPYDYLVAQEELRVKLKGVSPLLRRSFDAVVIQGRSPEYMAQVEGVSPDVIYKRIQRARDIIQGNNQ